MKTPDPARQDGFALLAVLLAVGVIAGLVATFGRHVIVDARAGMASPEVLASREACHSGLLYSRQALVSGTAVANVSLPVDECTATISVAPLAGGHQAVHVESLGSDGLGARRQFELGLAPAAASAPTEPTALPTLANETVDSLLANGSLEVHHYSHSQTLQGVELSGLLVIHPGAQVTFDDVVLHGAIVSSSVMSQTLFGDFDLEHAPQALVAGNLRIDPHPALPGVAVLMPDGVLTSTLGDARLQIHGDVVAHDVVLHQPGALAGNVAAVHADLVDESVLDRLGIERQGLPWSPMLQLGGAQEPIFVAAVPPATDLGALAPIIDFWQQD